MDAIFQALSSSVRRKILAYLSETSLTAGEIAERFDISKPALSKHLNVLMNAGLIESNKEGQYVHYRLVRDNLLVSLNDFLADFCPVGRPLNQESAELEAKKKGQESKG